MRFFKIKRDTKECDRAPFSLTAIYVCSVDEKLFFLSTTDNYEFFWSTGSFTHLKDLVSKGLAEELLYCELVLREDWFKIKGVLEVLGFLPE